MQEFKKADFAIKILIFLSINNKKNIDIIDISKLLNISIKYLEIIIFQLERNKILGIKNIDEKIFVYLAKPAAEITVTDLITSFKDKYILNNIERNTEDWIITDNMIHNFVWERIWEKIKMESDNIILEDIIKKYKNVSSYMNYI